MKTRSYRPLAVRLGLVHVSVARSDRSGWAAMVWLPCRAEPYPVSSGRTFEQAIDQARSFAAVDPMFMLELPVDHDAGSWSDLIHVNYRSDGDFAVSRQSAKDGTISDLAYFAADRRAHAIWCALAYAVKFHARLGKIA